MNSTQMECLKEAKEFLKEQKEKRTEVQRIIRELENHCDHTYPDGTDARANGHCHICERRV